MAEVERERLATLRDRREAPLTVPESDETNEKAPPQEAPAAPATGRHERLGRRTALVSSMTLISRVLGFVREAMSALLWGDKSEIYDAFITAYRVPNLFRRFLGEGALSTSFQTALTAVDADHGEAAGRVLFWRTLRALAALLVGLALVMMGAVSIMPDTMPLTGWPWLGDDPASIRELTVRVMPFVVLVCLSALFGGALHVRGRFGAPAIAPALMNVAWILVLLVIVWQFGLYGPSPEAPGELGVEGKARHLEMTRWLAWGVLAAGVVQLAVQWPALRAAGFVGGRPSLGALPEGAPGVMTVLRRAAPLAIGAAVYQVNVMVDGLMAEGLLPVGGPTNYYYANRLQQLPLALIAIAATSAVFPALQELGHTGKHGGLRALHDRTHLSVAAVALPAAAGLFALAEPVVEVVFERGAFGREGVERTTAALRVLCLAILPAGATGLVARTYYSMSDFVTPVKVSAAMLVLNIGLNAWFLVGLGLDVEGLALATGITSALNVTLLLPGLTRKLGLPSSSMGWWGPMVRIGLAAGACGVSSYHVEALLDGVVGRTLALGVAIGVGGATYVGAATLLRVEIVHELVGRVGRKLSGRSARNSE